MKKETLLEIILGTVGGLIFAIGMCMWLIPEWDLFVPGVVTTAIGFVVFCTYCCDTFALVFGLSFGKHKFAPITSPKKTWEGVIGGVATATILGTAYYAIFPFFDKPYGYWVSAILALILGIGAVWGDLIFSSIKRQFSIKDFGTIFPGHGGMLDRVDSLLLNILIFITVFGIYSMGMFS